MPSSSSYIAVIGDFVHRGYQHTTAPGNAADWLTGRRGPPLKWEEPSGAVAVRGGYLERLPLALLSLGLIPQAEIWDFGWNLPQSSLPYSQPSPRLTRRTFWLDHDVPPFRSADMLGFIEAFGPPRILCVWGLGVDETILLACADSVKIYNSIDAPTFRIPHETSRHFDLVLTGADWQSEEVHRLYPDMAVSVLPIGPDFADPETFRPLGSQKDYDIVYVAAAQAYKRHDILFNAMERLPRNIRALCVIGYGEMREQFETRARTSGLDIDFFGPPGVPFSEVNRLMNLAKIGVVCGVDDGAPAILTEYMLAGLPVLANAALRCGLHYITPQTGATATAADFHAGLIDLLARAPEMHPRDVVLSRWTWPHSARRLAGLIDQCSLAKMRR